jgi:hypothetical protein
LGDLENLGDSWRFGDFGDLEILEILEIFGDF